MLLVNVGQGKSLHCPQLCSPRPMEHKRIAHSAQNLCADAVSAWQPKQIRSSVVKVFCGVENFSISFFPSSASLVSVEIKNGQLPQSKPQQAKCFVFINQSPIPFIFFNYTYICRKSNCRKIAAYCKCIAVPHISQNEGGELT